MEVDPGCGCYRDKQERNKGRRCAWQCVYAVVPCPVQLSRNRTFGVMNAVTFKIRYPY